MTQPVYLDTFLAPLAPFLSQDDVTDIYVNRPQEIWIERLGGQIERIEAGGLTSRVMARLARQVAAHCSQGISREHPLLAANLPDGSRIQIILPPATRGEIALAIRKHVMADLSLGDMARLGNLEEAQISVRSQAAQERFDTAKYADTEELLRAAIRERRTILVCGGASTGKTTMLNALLGEIPVGERLILIEDTPELRLTHPNAVGLVAARGSMGEAEVTPEDLLVASLRMRPDRIILGEVRGSEAMTFLRAANTGHPGSLCTIHADTPERAIDQMALLVLQTGPRMAWEDITEYVRRSVDIVVQLDRQCGQRKVRNILAV
ncbi:P-type DNA transfer ATPase VirB11 [Erythrobacter vulgaris]|uniref:P-type DNA transfer ATPase VirB11 n=1 Tax=Qipengyuania vulgaris TaxID=291985 RepID=A0A844XUY7_9SPHN|nr:P-type DNA transfer ATPase VirB11 [Qipengyuania vulgaris]